MSMKNVESFFDLAKTNEELSKRLIKINTNIQEKEGQVLDYDQFVKEKIMPLAQEFGVTFSVDDFVEYTKSKLPNELSDEEVADVSGGVSLKTAAITFGTLLSVSLGAAAFLGMGGGLEASAAGPAEVSSSSTKISTTSKASHPKAAYNISDDEVNKMGPKIVTGKSKNNSFVFFDGKKVDDPIQIKYLKAVKSKFDQQFGQQIEQKLVQELDERIDDIENMSQVERTDLQRDIRKARRSVKNTELKEKLNDMLKFALKVSKEMDISERNAEQNLVQDLTKRTNNIKNMSQVERETLISDIIEAIGTVENRELIKELDNMLKFAKKVHQEMSKAEASKAIGLLQRIKQIRHQAESISRMDKYQIKKFIDDIDTVIKEFSTVIDVDQSTQEELSEIKDRAEQARQEIIKAEEEKIAQIRKIIKNLADENLENMSEDELLNLNRLTMEVPASTRPADIDEFHAKLGDVIEKKRQEEMEQEDQAQKEQLLELAEYIMSNNITSLNDVPEENRETFIENLNDVMETFYYNTNDISSLGEAGQKIINLINEKVNNEKAHKKTNRKPFKYEKIPYILRVASKAKEFAAKVIAAILRGKITSLSQVPEDALEAFTNDETTAVALLREAGEPIPDALGVIHNEIINNNEYKIDYQRFPEGDFNNRGEIVKEGTEEYEILRVEHIKTQLEKKGIWSLREVKNPEELIADIAKYSTYFTANHLALRPSPQLSKLEREIRENSEFLKLVREAVEAPSQSEESKNDKEGHVTFAENVVKRPRIYTKEYNKDVAPKLARKNMEKKLNEIKNNRQKRKMILQLNKKNQIRKIRTEQRKRYKELAVHLNSNYPIENFELDPKLGKNTEKLLKEFTQNTVINGGGTFLRYNDTDVYINDNVAETLFKYAAIKEGPIYFDTTDTEDYDSLVNEAMRCVVLNNGHAENIINAAEDAEIDGRENLKELSKALTEIKNKGTYDHLPQFMKDMTSNLLVEAEDLGISLD